MLILSSDLTAVILHLAERYILVVSVYMEPGGTEELEKSLKLLDNVIKKAREKIGQQIEVIFAGDFNRHDELWGGNNIGVRQGEADQLIKFMNQHSL